MLEFRRIKKKKPPKESDGKSRTEKKNIYIYIIHCNVIKLTITKRNWRTQKQASRARFQDRSRVGGSHNHFLPRPNWNYNWNIKQAIWIINGRPVEQKSYNKGFIEITLKQVGITDMKSAGPIPKGGGWYFGGILQLNISTVNVLPEKYGVSAPSKTPQTRAPELGRGNHVTSGCENQQEFCLPGSDMSLLENQVPSF